MYGEITSKRSPSSSFCVLLVVKVRKERGDNKLNLDLGSYILPAGIAHFLGMVWAIVHSELTCVVCLAASIFCGLS